MKNHTPAVALQHSLYTSRNPTRRYLHCRRRDWVLKQLEACGPTALALELGPGSGVYLPSLAALSETTLALDYDGAQLRAARATVRDLGATKLAYLQGDLRKLPIADESVDLLLLSEVIEHVRGSALLLSALGKLLKPGGKLILTTPQPFSPLELLGRIAFLPGMLQLLRFIYREPIEPTGHINVLRRRCLEQQLFAAGFRILKRDTLGLYLPVVAEFGGKRGQRFLARVESLLQRTPLRCLLWTQCYVLEVGHKSE